jgi:hypothetical protein
MAAPFGQPVRVHQRIVGAREQRVQQRRPGEGDGGYGMSPR